MPTTDFVSASISLSNANAPTVQALNVGLLAGYHNHYPDRLRIYSVATMLAQMQTDGFATSEALYKAASAYCAANPAPSLCCIGRRALPPLQSLQLTCTDGTVNDAYAATVVGSTGKSTALAYTNVINPGGPIPGAALTGTATVTPGSTAVTQSTAQSLTAGALVSFASQPGVAYTIAASTTTSTGYALTAPYTGPSSTSATATLGATTAVTAGSTAVTFSVAQTLTAGSLLMFASQPGVYYALSAAVTASTAGTLTAAYGGLTAAATNTTTLAALAGTFAVTNLSPVVPTSSTQVGTVAAGDSVQFTSQLGTYYTVASLTSTALTLTTPYTGATAGATHASDVCQVTTAAAALQYQLSQIAAIGTASVTGAVISLSRTDGALTDVQAWLSNGFGNLQLQDLTADPGIATDLNAIKSANPGAFYGVALDSNSAAEIKAAAAWAEATGNGGKVFFANNSDQPNTSSSSTTDVFSVLQGLSLKRTFLQQNNQQLLCYAGAATMGQALGMNPGSYSLAYKQLPNVPADNDTTLPEGQALALNTMTASNPGTGGKNGNYYKLSGGTAYLWPGVSPGGQFFDATVFIDWLSVQIPAALVAYLAAPPKVPLTQPGLNGAGFTIKQVLVLGSSAQYGGVVPQGADPTRPITVNVPLLTALTPAQRATRGLTGFSFSCGYTGALSTIVVNGTLVP